MLRGVTGDSVTPRVFMQNLSMKISCLSKAPIGGQKDCVSANFVQFSFFELTFASDSAIIKGNIEIGAQAGKTQRNIAL